MLETLLIKHLLFQVPLGQSLLSLDMELQYYTLILRLILQLQFYKYM